MNTAVFRFYADLNDFLAPPLRQRPLQLPIYGGDQTVKHLIESQGVPHTEVALILVDGRFTAFDYCVQPGDYVSVFPPFSTLELGQDVVALRPPLKRPVRFLLDNHLGRLARYLRLLGFDTLYFKNQLDDAQLAALAGEEKRVLLTRDRGLLKRKNVIYGYCLRTTDSREQLTAVLRRFGLTDQASPWTRCLRCNNPLEPVAKSDIADLLEPKTKRYFQEFRQCSGCAQVYWRGSHFGALQQFLDEALDEISDLT